MSRASDRRADETARWARSAGFFPARTTLPAKCQCGQAIPAVPIKCGVRAFTRCSSCGAFVEQRVTA